MTMSFNTCTALVVFHLLSATSAFTPMPRVHVASYYNTPTPPKPSPPKPLLHAVLLPDEGDIRQLHVVGRRRDALPSFDEIENSISFPLPADNSASGQRQSQQRGLMTIIGITFLFASNSPALHAAFTAETAPPVLLVNAAISTVALLGLVSGGDVLESTTSLPSTLQQDKVNPSARIQAGLELGLWKFLGTTANLAGLSLTTANHGAFLIQLTTLIVPVVQGLMGVPIAKRTQFSVLLALAGVFMFTQDGGCGDAASLYASATSTGDALCVAAAGFYAAYDLRLFQWGKKVAPRQLITGKIATQSVLSLLLLATCGSQETVNYFANESLQLDVILPVILWSGIAVNAVAPFLQVGGQQAVGPTRCQTIYASQPLWAAGMSYAFLGETVGVQGMAGGLAFLAALFLAATSPSSSSEESVSDEMQNYQNADTSEGRQTSPSKTTLSTWLELFHQIPPSRFGGGRGMGLNME